VAEEDRNAFLTRLYESYYDRLVLMCERMAGFQPELMPLAEECVQDVFHTALKKYAELADHPDVEGWLFRCGINHMNNALKTYYGRQKRHACSADEEGAAELFDPYDSFRAFEEEADLAETLDRIYAVLIEGEKEIFDRYFLDGYDLKAVARQLGKSESAAKSVIYRLRRRLRKTLVKNMLILLALSVSFSRLNT